MQRLAWVVNAYNPTLCTDPTKSDVDASEYEMEKNKVIETNKKTDAQAKFIMGLIISAIFGGAIIFIIIIAAAVGAIK